jgi:hypothetical protein
MKYNEYEIVKAKINKNLIGDTVILKPTNSKTGNMPTWFKVWSETVYQNQQPSWFKAWSETVYQNQQPAWFKTWSETQFEPRISKIENILDYNIKIGILKKPE